MPPEMPEQMAEVARHTSIPIATGERLTTKYEFARVLRHGAAASILQMALGRVGGLLEGQEDRRHGRGALCPDRAAPLLRPGRGRDQRAACRLHAELPDPGEHPEQLGRLPREILKKPMVWEDGYVIPPEAPRAWASSSTKRSPPPTPMTTPSCTWSRSNARSRSDRRRHNVGQSTGIRSAKNNVLQRRRMPMRYGFIGLGNLGAHLAASLVREAGFEVHVHDLDKNAAGGFCSRQARPGRSHRARCRQWRRCGFHLPAVAQGGDSGCRRSRTVSWRASATAPRGSR